MKTLRELAADDEPPFDLLVFDEASQVSLAHTLVLMPLGCQHLLAGDPQQLAPVLRSADLSARRWLGRSAFAAMPKQGTSVALLNEQSRMAAPIGDLVSQLFYEGQLRVAIDAQTSPTWQAARQRAFGSVPVDAHLHVLPVRSEGAWSAADRGPVRRESAELIARLVLEALGSCDWQPQDIVVLTPFRAQRALLRHTFNRLGLPETVRVSTVHRAQGSEAAVVLFDPADGTQPFLQTEYAARLINVAWSRAQAKLIVALSSADARNPWLAPITQRLRLAGDTRPATPLQHLATAADFPRNALGQRVTAGRLSGEVTR